jgi:hypothetical protein
LNMKTSTLLLFIAALVITSAAQTQQPKSIKRGLPQGWTSRYISYAGPLTSGRMANPEAVNAWMQHLGRKAVADRTTTILQAKTKTPRKKKTSSKVDWNVSLGAAGATLAPFAYPAKFSFDVNAVPSCADDFVTYGLAVSGSATQASVIGFNNLYSSGQPSGGGMCDAANNGLPTTLFAFNTSTLSGGTIEGSLTLSLDGTRMAFSETSGLSNASSFHVLRWGNGGGSSTAPLIPDPHCVTSCLWSVPLGTSYTKSAYVDYASDSAYVVDGNGALWRIDHVFNGVPSLATSDSDWPASGFCQTSAGSAGVTSVFFVNGRIYFTEGQQTLHIISRGPVCTDVVITLAPQGVVVDSPLFSVLDDTHGSVFVFARDKDGNTAVYQTDLDGNLLRSVTVVSDGGAAPPAGSFDNAYWSDSNAASGYLYFTNTSQTSTAGGTLLRVGFSGSTTMSGSVDSNKVTFTTQGGSMISSLTEIFNPSNTTSPDSLFLQGARKCGISSAAAGCIQAFALGDASFSVTGEADEAQQADYTGGIVVDNVADPNSYSQASSLYFATPGKAVKLTQSGLQ